VITDTNGAQITNVSYSLAELSDGPILVVVLSPLANQFLAAALDTRAKVLARRTDSGNAFVDIAASPINLTPWAGQRVSFDVRVQTLAVTGLERVAIPVRVTYNP